MNDDFNRDVQLEQLLEELKQKREQPDALRFATVEEEILSVPDKQPETPAQQFAPRLKDRGITAPRRRETPPEVVPFKTEFVTSEFRIGHQPEPTPSAVPSAPQSAQPAKPQTLELLPQQPDAGQAAAVAVPDENTLKPARRKKEKKKAASFSKRHIRGALNAGEEDYQDDPINKSMLAPTIERGIDVEIKNPVMDLSREEEKSEIERVDKAEYTENHPLFTQSITRQVVIPDEPREDDTKFYEESKRFQTSEIIMDDYTKRVEKKGVLNVKDNLDDNFREFFGDSVIIDKESLGEKSKKQRKVKDFVLPDKDGEIGGPVFEDDVESVEEVPEYRSDADTESTLAELMSKKAKSTLRMVFSGIFAILLVALSLLAEFDATPDLVSEPLVFYVLHALLLLLVVLINAKQVFGGLLKLLAFRADGEMIMGFAAVMAVVEVGLRIVTPGELAGLYGSVAALGLFFNALGTQLSVKRVLQGFRTVSENYDKYASAMLDDQQFTRRITRELEINNPRVLLKRKAGFTDGFMPHAFSSDNCGRKIGIFSSVALLVAVGCGAIAYFTSDAGNLFGVMCVAAVLGAPFAATIAGALPIYKMQKKLSKVGAVVPGYSAAEEVCDTNCIVVSGRELFPKGNVMLHGIKTFERERIDTAILYAASVLIQSCDTMAHMFMNVIQNKTEMLYEVDSVEFEAGLGFSFWVEKNRILLGTRELLRTHDIDVPSRDYENRYTKTSTRDAVYLAVAGKLYAMFVVSYRPNAEVRDAVRGLVREGIGILVHTRDFNLTSERIAKFYRIPKSMVAIVRENDMTDLTKKTEFTSHAPSVLTTIGTLTSFVKGIVASYNVRSAARLSANVELAGLIVGILLAVVLTLLGAIQTIGVLSILLFQLLWCLILYILVSLHRY